MKTNEKKSFLRFFLIYLSISFLLFISLALYQYYEQKRMIEDSLAIEMSSYGGQFRDLGEEVFPEGFEVNVLPKESYPYPAFIKENESYISTSCGGFDYAQQIVVVKADPSIIQKRVQNLKEKIFYFMLISFIINLFLAMFLSWISLKPIRTANREFREFVDDIIHDLNAPISAININLESLEKKYDDKQIVRISRSIDTIKNLYLNLEVLLQHEYKSIFETIEIKKACEKIVYQLQPLFPMVTFIVDIPDIKVNMNYFAFERVIVNLIQNAAKYTKSKPIVTLGIDEKNQFYVKDNGPGMFDPQTLLKRSIQANKNNVGYGLGLSIVKRLSNECGIHLSIESKIDQGTTFYFDIDKLILRE